MAAPKAPLLDAAGKKSKDVALEEAVFGAEVKPHLVHEAVRAELNADRAGTRGAKTRGLVAGGRAKPWRQKGTGRARAGTIRAPQFTGGGVAFPPTMRIVRGQGEQEGAPRRAALGARPTTPRRHDRRRRRRLVRRAVDEGRRRRCSPRGSRSCRSRRRASRRRGR